jgi:hypothetical protein
VTRRAHPRRSRPAAPAWKQAAGGAPGGPARPRAGLFVLLLAASLGAALWIYRPALSGPFVSDDHHYLFNPVVSDLSFDNALRTLDPTSDVAFLVSNYAPVSLLLHAVALRVFGDDTTGHHVLNVSLHALASVLFAALLLSIGLPLAAAIAGGALFLAHPANVEAVAWISQLKSSSSLVLALLALLAYPRRPALASVCFALALLAKGHAVFVLPVAGLFEWTRSGRVRWGWIALWAAIFAAYSVAQIVSHERNQAAVAALGDPILVRAGTIVAIALRYLVMAATSLGVSAFHETASVRSPFDPWLLAGLVVLAGLGWRLLAGLRRRSPEAAFWCWALFAFAPVSQVFPFLYPMGDRYLYFILPGLLGAVLWAGHQALARLPAAGRRRAAAAAAGIAVIVCGVFALRSHQRAAIWRSPASLVADAAAHYPEGVSANILRAQRAGRAGDVDGVVAALRAAAARGYNRFEQIDAEPAFAGVRDDPAFRAVVAEIAAGWIRRVGALDAPTQQDLRMMAHAHAVRGEREQAIAALRRALALGGPGGDRLRADLAALGASP